MPTDSPAEPIDLRGLPAPEPLEHILDALAATPGAPRRFIVPHVPRPLMAILRGMHTPYAVRIVEGGCEIVIGADSFDP